MRISSIVLLASAALSAACTKSNTTELGSMPAQDRAAPLIPATRDQLAQGRTLDCSMTTPDVCTTTNPDCTLTFDSQDELTHLRCSVQGLIFECTKPCNQLFACTWSDTRGCADIYAPDGTFQGYLCGAALQGLIGQCGGGGNRCANLDEMSCQPPCRADYCKLCDNVKFAGCNAPDAPPPPCPLIACPSCYGLDERACLASPSCKPAYCPRADGTVEYAGCQGPNDPGPTCMGPPPPNRCANLDEKTCAAATDACHPVYFDDQMCACPGAGCCAHFDHCAGGGQARCDAPNVICDLAAPHCEGDYVIAYTDSCYEGCVLKSECRASPSACGPNGVFPTFDKSCMGNDGCVAGIHQTNCCGDHEAIGISSYQKDKFDQVAAECDRQFPACGCPTHGIMTEDGKWVLDPSQIGVGCTAAGECRTFAR